MISKYIVVVLIALLVGCSSANSRYPGWDKVRIEGRLPNQKCVYVSQVSCFNADEGCANYHKKLAAKAGANTVIFTDGKSTGYLADYYICPQIVDQLK